MNHFLRRTVAALLSSGILLCCTGCGASKSPLDPKNPTTITVWNYYNGDQLAAFESLVSKFNDTIGVEQGIIVNSVSQGSINTLADCLNDAVAEKAGAQDIPDLASIYGETAYILDQEEVLLPLDDYFTEEERSAYIPSFLEEGRLTEDGSLILFPVSKSTECFVANTTDWTDFAAASGITPESIDSVEALTAAAEAYYNWTDGLTPDVPDDGKALYGRDSVANYVFISAKQLGHPLFTVDKDGTVTTDMDHDTFRAMWDNYYIPFINGYFGASASYRSEDMKTGVILALTGSTSGASYLPDSVTDANDVTHPIEITTAKPLSFASAQEYVAVQQGAGYCVFKSDEARQYASVAFLKWFTDPEQNLAFSVSSGYSPVTIEANDAAQIEANLQNEEVSAKSTNILDALLISSDIYINNTAYTTKPFTGSKEVRDILQNALEQTAINDRAAVVAAIAGGATHEEAVAAYSTDDYFENWYNNLCTAVEAAIQ